MANTDTNFPIAGTGLTLSADAQWGVGMATITDGSVIAIGGPLQDGASGTGPNNTGVVQVYNVDLTQDPPTYTQRGGNIIGSANDALGYDLHLSNDANRIWIGGNNKIVIYDYDSGTNSWTLGQTINGSGSLGIEFAVTSNSTDDGKYMAAYDNPGIGVVRYYENSGGAPGSGSVSNYTQNFDFAPFNAQEPSAGGDDMKIFWDGNAVSTGTQNVLILQGEQNFDEPNGRVLLWQLNSDNNGFNVVQTFSNPIGGSGNWGRSLNSTNDGTRLIIGSLQTNTVQVWNTTTDDLFPAGGGAISNPYTLQATITGPNPITYRFGSSVAIADDGNIVIGEPYYNTGNNNGVGAVYLGFVNDYQNPFFWLSGGTATDRLGTEVQMNNNMSLVLAGGLNGNSTSAVSSASNEGTMCLPGGAKVIKMVEQQ